jgi:hypothetical protein
MTTEVISVINYYIRGLFLLIMSTFVDFLHSQCVLAGIDFPYIFWPRPILLSWSWVIYDLRELIAYGTTQAIDAAQGTLETKAITAM